MILTMTEKGRSRWGWTNPIAPFHALSAFLKHFILGSKMWKIFEGDIDKWNNMMSKARLKKLSPWNSFEYSMKNIQNTSHMQKIKHFWQKKSKKKNRSERKQWKQECIPVGCIPTTVVAATRCQFQRGLPRGGLPREGICLGVGFA